MPAANSYVICNFSNRDVALPKQHLRLLHSQHIQVIAECPTRMALKNSMQISGMQIYCGSDVLNLNVLVIVLMQKFDAPAHIKLRGLLAGMKLLLPKSG